MPVRARGAKDPESLHDGEARSVGDREVLIREVLPVPEGDVQIGGDDDLDRDRAGPARSPEPLCRVSRPSRCATRNQDSTSTWSLVCSRSPFLGLARGSSRRRRAPVLE